MILTKAISKTRNTGTAERRNSGTPEQHYSGTRNTGTLKIFNLLKIRKKSPGGGGEVTGIIIACVSTLLNVLKRNSDLPIGNAIEANRNQSVSNKYICTI